MRRWFLNSFVIATAFTLLILIIDSLAAYAYARMEFRGSKLLFGLLLATLVMPSIMFLIPNYITIANLGWLGTYQGVIAPGLSGVFGVFFLRQFFLSLPRELEEAAIVDGANTWQTFTRVVLPLSRGALATLGVITFLESWNDFLWPLLVTGGDRDMQTLPVGLATLQGQYTFDYGKLMAGALVLTLPVLVLFVSRATVHREEHLHHGAQGMRARHAAHVLLVAAALSAVAPFRGERCSVGPRDRGDVHQPGLPPRLPRPARRPRGRHVLRLLHQHRNVQRPGHPLLRSRLVGAGRRRDAGAAGVGPPRVR